MSSVPTVAVKRGPLTISVLEAGALKAKDPEILRSGLQGRATIISIVPEGTRVNEGDLLVELDVSKLVDHRVDHEIMVKNAEASFINAREMLTIVTSQAQSSVELAELALEFAKQDLDKYTGNGGEYENMVAAAEGKIKLNAEERTKAADYLDWSQKLFSEKYLSKTQLQADQLALQRADLNLQVASNDANLLKQYTYKRQIAKLTSDVTQAERALERAQRGPAPISPRRPRPWPPSSSSTAAIRKCWRSSTIRSARASCTRRRTAWSSTPPAAWAGIPTMTAGRWRTASRSGSGRN